MNSSNNSLISFLTWWQRGLLLPWQFTASSKQLISNSGEESWELVSGGGEKTVFGDSDALHGQSFYLLAQQNIIQTQVPKDKIEHAAEDVARELLPFSNDELFTAKNISKNELFAVLKKDVRADISELEAAGVKVLGIGFEARSGYCFSEFDSRADGNAHTLVRLLGGIVLATAILCAVLVGLAWNSQSKTQQLLTAKLNSVSEQYAQIESSDSLDSAQFTLDEISNRSADEVLDILSLVVTVLPADAEIDQLILNQQELVIDARATSATAMQAALDGESLFSSVEFITAISSNATSEQERFRLSAQLPKPNEGSE